MRINSNLVRLLLGLLVFAVADRAVAAISVPMNLITNNAGVNISSQLIVKFLSQSEAVSAYGAFSPAMGANDVLLTIQNNVGTASNIAEVYVKSNALKSLLSPPSPLQLGGTVDFSVGSVNPNDLPGSSWAANESFSADVNPGSPDKGVNNAADILGLVYSTNSPFGLAALQADLASGGTRIGLHVRSIGTSGTSDSYENTTIPEASSIAIWGLLGFGGVGLVRRRNMGQSV